MRYIVIFYFLLLTGQIVAQINPADTYKEMFHEVQMKDVFNDSKTFTDCRPKQLPVKILESYLKEYGEQSFSLDTFIQVNFDLPYNKQSEYESDTSITVEQHIKALWKVLLREPENQETWSSIISLPNSYVVPGGRFREIYYWDSYFTMLGLVASGENEVVKNMLDNFNFLIEEFGFIPNGNRTYYLSRSQPPFFSLMVKLWGEINGPEAMLEYLPALEKEYLFWMNGMEDLDSKQSVNHLVKMENGTPLNRYWDYRHEPRPESYREDVELALSSQREAENIYLNIRAAAESGWDFSSRWFADNQSLKTICTTDIIPIDLNCLLYHLEIVLAELEELNSHPEKSENYRRLANRRKDAIFEFLWNSHSGYFSDLNYKTNLLNENLTMAAAFPLFFNIATKNQAESTVEAMLGQLEKQGGFVTTTINTGQQWDNPNGWPPLQYIGVHALLNYGYNNDAWRIANKWLNLNRQVFKKTGRMMEKYNVTNLNLEAGGGEYPLQDGFGWTNGVYMALKKEFEN